ncbi:MAG: ComEC/Rec2 family competence protein [Planctomycetia bacterium]|nr:ComEC/Rec2 family competence protein [Planctomycetia bacterium]
MEKISSPHEDEYNPLAVCFVGAALGIGIGDLLNGLNGYEITSRPPLFWIVPFLFFTGCLFYFYRRFQERTIWGALLLVLLIASFFGFRFQLYSVCFPQSEIGFRTSRQSSPVFLDGWICDLPSAKLPSIPPLGRNIEPEIQTRFIVKAKAVSNGRQWDPCSGFVSVIVSGEADHLFRIGDLVRLKGYINRPSPVSNPCDFDMNFQLRTQRINTLININRPENVQILKRGERWMFLRFFGDLRRQSQKALEKNLSPRNAAIASAMILGLREDIDEDLQAQFQETGTAHILAISGMHLTIISGFFYFLLRIFCLSIRFRSACIALIILFYFMLTDGRPPVLRSSILVWTACLAVFMRRPVLQLNNLLFAALCILMYNPMELFQFGTQLSFLATAAFVWFAQKTVKEKTPKEPEIIDGTKEALSEERSKKRKASFTKGILTRLGLKFCLCMKDLFLSSIVVWFVLLPIIVRKLNLLTPIALVLNPIIFIPMSFAFISGLILVVLAWISPGLAAYFSFIPDFLFDLFLGILNGAHACPGGYFWCPGFSDLFCWGFYLPLIAATLFSHLRKYKKAYLIFLLCWGTVCIGVHQIDQWIRLRKGESEIILFSVGHGSAALIHFPDGRVIVHDCGNFSAPRRVGTLLAKNLWKMGKTHIDLVIFSHPDSDHYNAFDLLAKYFSIGGAVVPPIMFDKKNQNVELLKKMIDEKEIPVFYKTKDESLAELGFPEIRILHPHRGNFQKYMPVQSNANSLVVLLEHEERNLLFPGDLDTRNALFLDEFPVKLDLLIAPHHGGKSENYQKILEWGRPRWILISGGLRQRNPASEQKLCDAGYIVYNTLEDGAIRIFITKEKMNVVPWRK